MSTIQRVQWTIQPKTSPRPWLTCNRCHAIKPFASSGKFRLNANGKQLDAWLVYRCADCESTWNRPIFERRHVKDIDPAALHSLQSNDMELVRSIAFDAQSLRCKSTRVEEFVDVDVRKEILIEGSEPWSASEIVLSVPTPTSLRLDRLLSTELDVSRSYISELARDGRLRVTPERGHELRRSIVDGTKITIILRGAGDDWRSGSALSLLGRRTTLQDARPIRHCERSEAIQGPQYDRLGCWRRACCGPWIASSQGLLAMTDGSPLTRSIR